MFVLNNKTRLKPGKSWKDDDGFTHPSNWATAWSAEEKTARGIKEVTEDPRPDDKFYRVTRLDLDGKWVSKPKKLDDTKVTVDGVETTTPGLKSEWIAKTKKTANGLLSTTDWQVIAKAERDRAIDSNVATYRAAVVSKCAAIEKSITDIADTAVPSGYNAAKEKTDPTDAEKKIISDYETEVATKFAAFKALFDAPVDSDGKPTGNPPMHDWPVLGD